MERALSLNELCSTVKREVLRSVGDKSKFYSNGVFDIAIAMRDGTIVSFYEDATHARVTLCNTMLGEQESYVGDYARMNAQQRRTFMDYLAIRCLEERVTADGFRWIQESGADNVASEMLNRGNPLVAQKVSKPFYVL